MSRGHAIDYGDGILYADIDYLARILRTPVPTLRRWASLDHWPRRRLRGRMYYLLTSATRSHDTRHARQRRSLTRAHEAIEPLH